MTAPHPALLSLARQHPVGHVDDEELFLASALEHRMLGAVSAAVRAGGLDLSPEIATRIGMLDLKQRDRHRRFWTTVNELQDTLHAHGIEVAIVKGIATELRWYDDMGERISTDLDVWLSPDALAQADLATSLIDPSREHTALIKDLVDRRLLQHVDLRFETIPVDLHFDPFKIGLPIRQLRRVWDKTEVVSSDRGTIRMLAPETELVLLLLHLNKDAFSMLGSFLDVRRLLERAPLDWDSLAEFVRDEGLEVPVWCSLSTVVETLAMDVPVPPVPGWRACSWRWLWGRTLGGYEGRERAPRRQRFLALHARGRGRDIRREVRRQLLPQRQLLELADRLGPGEPYVRYLWRRLARDSGPVRDPGEAPVDRATDSSPGGNPHSG